MVFKPEFSWEFLSKDEITARSLKALRNHIAHLKEVSPFYREQLAAVEPSDITSFDTFAQLPFTDRTTLVNDVERFRAVPESEIAETVVTSGATGKPLIFSMTKSDLDRLAFNEALSLHAAGVIPEDRAQILISLDRLFITGMSFYRGLTSLGVNTARIGELSFDQYKQHLDLLKPTVLIGIPSFLKKLAQHLVDAGLDLKASSVQKIICVSESLRNESLQLNSVGQKLQELFGAHVYSSYGVTELSVAYCECVEQNGNHTHPELIYTEIIDEHGKPVPDGTPGELVGTPLGVEGIPLLRYRTGDMSFTLPGGCGCGRNSIRIGPIPARKSQMIKLEGTMLYPQTITDALDELEYVNDYVILLEGDESFADRVTLHVATQPTMLESLSTHLRAKTQVTIPVLISNVATINAYREDSKRKDKIIDRRKRK